MFGLPENVLILLKAYFQGHPHITQVYIYGSRTMGKEKPGSDVDLAIVSQTDQDISGRVKLDLEELPTPYLFDVIDYKRISHLPLKEHIDRVGKLLFQRLNA